MFNKCIETDNGLISFYVSCELITQVKILKKKSPLLVVTGMKL